MSEWSSWRRFWLKIRFVTIFIFRVQIEISCHYIGTEKRINTNPGLSGINRLWVFIQKLFYEMNVEMVLDNILNPRILNLWVSGRSFENIFESRNSWTIITIWILTYLNSLYHYIPDSLNSLIPWISWIVESLIPWILGSLILLVIESLILWILSSPFLLLKIRISNFPWGLT